MSNKSDTLIIVSSELVSEVMEKYFNEVMFKQPAQVMGLKATETGYAFQLNIGETKERDDKGRFTKK